MIIYTYTCTYTCTCTCTYTYTYTYTYIAYIYNMIVFLMNGNFHQFFEGNFYGQTRYNRLHGRGCGCLHQTHLDLLEQLGGLQVYQKLVG